MQILSKYDPATIDDLKSRDEFFWLDLENPGEQVVAALGERFDFHRLALDDALQAGQRPKLQSYDDGRSLFLVYYGAHASGGGGDDTLIEVHAFLSGSFVITLRSRSCDVFDDLRERLPRMNDNTEQFVIYRVLEALTDSFFPALEAFGDRIDQLETEILDGPEDTHLPRIFEMRRELLDLRKVIAPQRDLLAHGTEDILQLPGLERDSRNYFRDLYDHMLRISGQAEDQRELISGARDAYLSMVSNRLNSISERLTIIATIFLPLAFVVGFFGQNFKWMTDHLESFAAFAVFGIGGVVVAGVAIYLWFRRSGFV